MTKKVKKADLKKVIEECFRKAYVFDNISQYDIIIDSIAATITHPLADKIFNTNTESSKRSFKEFREFLDFYCGDFVTANIIPLEKIVIHIKYDVVN